MKRLSFQEHKPEGSRDLQFDSPLASGGTIRSIFCKDKINQKNNSHSPSPTCLSKLTTVLHLVQTMVQSAGILQTR